eukprot:s314_g37.t1
MTTPSRSSPASGSVAAASPLAPGRVPPGATGQEGGETAKAKRGRHATPAQERREEMHWLKKTCEEQMKEIRTLREEIGKKNGQMTELQAAMPELHALREQAQKAKAEEAKQAKESPPESSKKRKADAVEKESEAAALAKKKGAAAKARRSNLFDNQMFEPQTLLIRSDEQTHAGFPGDVPRELINVIGHWCEVSDGHLPFWFNETLGLADLYGPLVDRTIKKSLFFLGLAFDPFEPPELSPGLLGFNSGLAVGILFSVSVRSHSLTSDTNWQQFSAPCSHFSVDERLLSYREVGRVLSEERVGRAVASQTRFPKWICPKGMDEGGGHGFIISDSAAVVAPGLVCAFEIQQTRDNEDAHAVLVQTYLLLTWHSGRSYFILSGVFVSFWQLASGYS